MSPEEIATKADKVIKMNKGEATINKVYFNPLFAHDLSIKVPELKEAGIVLSQTETETKDGTLVAGNIMGPSGVVYSLGSVLLDGESVKVQKALSPVDNLIGFIRTELQTKVQ